MCLLFVGAALAASFSQLKVREGKSSRLKPLLRKAGRRRLARHQQRQYEIEHHAECDRAADRALARVPALEAQVAGRG
ncbi:hypothetical protein [Luteimonas salinilitoris]|uniref:hypothetical protein n=1 Tax=Luteimonas salinilitoris TaxID=3237697 RepID=UPI00351C850A